MSNPNQNEWSMYNNILTGNAEPSTPGSSSSNQSRPSPLGFANYTSSSFNLNQQDLEQQIQQLQTLQRLQELQRELGLSPQQFQTQFQTQSQPQTQPQTQPQSQPQSEVEPSNPGDARKKRSHTRKGKGVRREPVHKKIWTSAEEVWLARCWLDASENPIVGNSQKYYSLWGSVMQKFNDNDNGWFRNEDALSGKWRYVDKGCKAFQGYYEAEKRNPRRSGKNEQNFYEDAVKAYCTNEMKTWAFKDAWEFLKDKPKWLTPAPVGGAVYGGRLRDEEEEDDVVRTIDITDDRPENVLLGNDAIERPIGRDRAKKAARTSASSDASQSSRSTNSSKFQELCEQVNEYRSEVVKKKIEQMDTITKAERMKAALEATKWISSLDINNIRNPKERKRCMKMKKNLLEEYGDLIQVSDEDDDDE